MLRVRLHKSCKENLTEYEMRILRNAANFSIDYHGIGHKKHTLDIYIKDTLTSSSLKNGDGDRTVGQYISYSLLKSEIYLKSDRNIFSIAKTLFHEMTHLKQDLKYDVCYTKYGKTWKGIPFPVIDPEDFSSYWNAPHEVHARKHANKMFIKWILKKITFWKGNKK